MVNEMTLMEFSEKYGTEEQCRKQLFDNRWPEGFTCPRCGHGAYFNIASRNLYQCKACRYQASLTAGTIMDRTRTPLRKWFMAFYLMAEDKRGISALALKGKIGVAYQTAWTMCHKIRHAMGGRDSSYALSGVVELDEAFFGAPTEGGKRGRGTDKTAVLVSLSLTESGKPGYAKMKAVGAADGETVLDFAKDSIAKGSELHTDGLNIYAALPKNGYTLRQKKSDPKEEPGHLHWLHIIISNAKSFFDGTFHGLDSIHLQRYLDEYCYRFNRRRLDPSVFASLVFACASSSKITYHELTG